MPRPPDSIFLETRHEASRQVDWLFTRDLGFGEGDPPACRASLTTSISELSEGICMISNYFLSKKVDWFAFLLFIDLPADFDPPPEQFGRGQ